MQYQDQFFTEIKEIEIGEFCENTKIDKIRRSKQLFVHKQHEHKSIVRDDKSIPSVTVVYQVATPIQKRDLVLLTI